MTRAGALSIARSAASGRVTGLTLNATTTTRTYNSFQEPLTESTTLPGATAFSEVFTRDAVGRIVAKTETAPSGQATTYAYAYDPAGRLTEVTRNNNPYRAYTYDANGNRTSTTRQTQSGPVAEPATYDAQDKQVTSGAFDLTYNANGELTAKTNRETNAEQTYSYSTLGALKSVTTPGGAEISYNYDAQGNRVETKTDGEASQRLIYAPGMLGPVAELETADHAETRYVYASRINVPDYMVRGGRTYRFVTDQLGSVRFVVDSSTGEIAQEITYDPFGEVLSDSAPGFQPFGFAGGLYDSATGLTHFGAREYDAGLGRWTSTDPISFGGGDSNLYGYVLGDPVNFVDPQGLLRVFGHTVTPSLTQTSNFVAGFGDAASFGFTQRVREAWGYNDVVNQCSGLYKGGGYTGDLVGLGAGYGGALKAAKGVKTVSGMQPGGTIGLTPDFIAAAQGIAWKKLEKKVLRESAENAATGVGGDAAASALGQGGCQCR